MEYHIKKEQASAWTHGLGWIAAMVASPFLLLEAFDSGISRKPIAVLVYCIGLLMVYTSSSLYHMTMEPTKKFQLRMLDHISIYYLIAGTYTPFLFLFLGQTWGLVSMIVVWTMAITGTLFKVFFKTRFNIVSTAAYVVMGWLAVFIVKPFIAYMPADVLWLIAAGGLSYTVGVLFYLWKRLFYHHAIWHLFVMGGSICHFIAVWKSIPVEPI